MTKKRAWYSATRGVFFFFFFFFRNTSITGYKLLITILRKRVSDGRCFLFRATGEYGDKFSRRSEATRHVIGARFFVFEMPSRIVAMLQLYVLISTRLLMLLRFYPLLRER